MCLELISDLLAEVDDAIIGDLVDLSERLQKSLTPEDVRLLGILEEHHRGRCRSWAGRALLAGVAMGRGLAQYAPSAGAVSFADHSPPLFRRGVTARRLHKTGLGLGGALFRSHARPRATARGSGRPRSNSLVPDSSPPAMKENKRSASLRRHHDAEGDPT